MRGEIFSLRFVSFLGLVAPGRPNAAEEEGTPCSRAKFVFLLEACDLFGYFTCFFCPLAAAVLSWAKAVVVWDFAKFDPVDPVWDFFGILCLASSCLVQLLLLEPVLPEFRLLPSPSLPTLAGGADDTEEDLEVLP